MFIASRNLLYPNFIFLFVWAYSSLYILFPIVVRKASTMVFLLPVLGGFSRMSCVLSSSFTIIQHPFILLVLSAPQKWYRLIICIQENQFFPVLRDPKLLFSLPFPVFIELISCSWSWVSMVRRMNYSHFVWWLEAQLSKQHPTNPYFFTRHEESSLQLYNLQGTANWLLFWTLFTLIQKYRNNRTLRICEACNSSEYSSMLSVSDITSWIDMLMKFYFRAFAMITVITLQNYLNCNYVTSFVNIVNWSVGDLIYLLVKY